MDRSIYEALTELSVLPILNDSNASSLSPCLLFIPLFSLLRQSCHVHFPYLYLSNPYNPSRTCSFLEAWNPKKTLESCGDSECFPYDELLCWVLALLPGSQEKRFHFVNWHSDGTKRRELRNLWRGPTEPQTGWVSPLHAPGSSSG